MVVSVRTTVTTVNTATTMGRAITVAAGGSEMVISVGARPVDRSGVSLTLVGVAFTGMANLAGTATDDAHPGASVLVGIGLW